MTGIQSKLWAWQKENFGVHDRTELQLALGVNEEAGELAHAVLKKDQGIRGTPEQHMADMKDAIADIAIYSMMLCSLHGWDFSKIINETAENVILKRNWKKNPENGG